MALPATSTSTAAGQPTAQSGLFGASGGDFNMFLKLLTTQMQNQDPLNPMDTSQYTQQLVQYSQVEQSITQTGVLRDILGRLSTQDLTQASNLIGRQVQIDSTIAGFSGEPARWDYSLPRNATRVTATITDASGRTVATKTLDPNDRTGSFTWDGTLADGRVAPAGAYSLSVQATDATSSFAANVYSVGLVQDVTAAGGILSLGVNGITHPASKVIRIAANT